MNIHNLNRNTHKHILRQNLFGNVHYHINHLKYKEPHMVLEEENYRQLLELRATFANSYPNRVDSKNTKIFSILKILTNYGRLKHIQWRSSAIGLILISL